MGKSIVFSAGAFLAALVGVPATWGQLTVQPDKENVVASRLEGPWEPDAELTKRLGGHAIGKLTFTKDAGVAARIPAKFETFLKSKQIYMAGMMAGKGKQYPFVLIEHKGNPYIVFFRERDSDPLGDAESFNVMLAVAEDQQNDLLFVGGDFNNQPFSAYRRVKGDAKSSSR
jgi:hypothetical protein